MKVVPQTSNLNGYRGIASLTHILQYYFTFISSAFLPVIRTTPPVNNQPPASYGEGQIQA